MVVELSKMASLIIDLCVIIVYVLVRDLNGMVSLKTSLILPDFYFFFILKTSLILLDFLFLSWRAA